MRKVVMIIRGYKHSNNESYKLMRQGVYRLVVYGDVATHNP